MLISHTVSTLDNRLSNQERLFKFLEIRPQLVFQNSKAYNKTMFASINGVQGKEVTVSILFGSYFFVGDYIVFDHRSVMGVL